jgi:hypothetical protein
MSDALTLPGWLTPTLLGLVAAGLLWVIKTLSTLVTEARVTNVTLFGQTGTNGLNGRMRDMEARQDAADEKADDRAHRVNNKLHEFDTRLTVVERTRSA